VSWRRQLPAYSPLPLRAVVAGAAGLVAGGPQARRSVAETVQRHLDARDVLLTDSGTSALALAIGACLAGRPGAGVALPAYGCYDLATATDGAGAPVVLYDVDPNTLAPDLDSLRRASAQGVGAVVLAHLYGIPADPEPVRAAMADSGALLIEDAAQGAGATLRGRPLGAFGDVAVLSFGRGKGVTAGRGGALLALSGAGADCVDSARDRVLPPGGGLKELVQLKVQWLFGRPSLYGIPASLPFLQLGETIYHPPSPARGLSAVAARTLAVTWPLSQAEAETRRARAARLLERAGAGLAPVVVGAGAVAGYLRLPFVASPAARAAAGTLASRALGVMPGYPQALCDLDGFASRARDGGERFLGARGLARQLITLPTHGRTAERDLARLGDEIARW
jgi:perosamine synthetase